MNTALAANNLSASINSAGALTFTTTNDHAHATIGALGGSAVAAGAGLFGASVTVNAPVEDANAQNNRATLISQYNAVIDQIKTTAQDSSFNGVNLLNGDQLKLVFNETGKSTLTIQGVTFDPAGLGLSSLTKGTDFLDNASTNKVLEPLEQLVQHAALGGFDLRFEPVDRADPSGLLEEPDQRAADRLVQPDACRHQRGSGEQPGAVHPPVDRGVRAGAGQPVEPERASAPPLIRGRYQTTETAGETPPFCL